MGEIYNRYPNVRKEINMAKTSLSFNDTYITFHNGSQIVCVTSSENSRGNRCAILINEESAKMDQDMKVNVLAKFLQNGDRIPRYKDNPKYASFKPRDEKKKQIHITSAEFQTNPVYKECMDAIEVMMEEGVDSTQAVISMHWGFPVAEPYINMTYEDDIKPEMRKSTWNKLWWSMENEGLFCGESQFSLYGYQELTKTRKVENILQPIPDYLFSNKKDLDAWKKKNPIKKGKDEKIVLSIDVALMGGNNDNTVYTIVRATPKGNRYKKKVVYIEHVSNAHSEEQSLKMKRLYYDMEVDVICMDCMGNGMSIADSASKSQYDPTRDIEYPPFTVFNREDMKDRIYGADIKEAISCIFGIKQSSAINHQIITGLKTSIENGTLELPIDTDDAKANYIEQKLDDTVMNELLKTNIETDLLVREMTALEVKQQTNSPYLKVENNSLRKDRFSSLGFANYWIQLEESELSKEVYSYNEDEDIDWYFEL